MHFHYENGKHFVNHNGQVTALPKAKCIIDWSNQKFEMLKDHKIVFKHDGSKFTRANELQPYGKQDG